MSNQESHIFVCSSGFLVNLDLVGMIWPPLGEEGSDIMVDGVSFSMTDPEKQEIQAALIAYGKWKAKAMSGQLMMEAMQNSIWGKMAGLMTKSKKENETD